MSNSNGLRSTKQLQGSTIQQMWQILRAHEIRLNGVSDYLEQGDEPEGTHYETESEEQDEPAELTPAELTPVEKHVSTLKGGKKKTKGKKVTLNIVEEN